jgi:hypothetical protein
LDPIRDVDGLLGSHSGQLLARDCDRQPLQRIAISARSPGVHESIPIGIELQAVRRPSHAAAAKKNLERFRRGNS